MDSTDQIPRAGIIPLKRFQAEGIQTVTKIVLGWLINTKSLQISLPGQNYISWTMI